MFRFLVLAGSIVVILSLTTFGQQAPPAPGASYLSGVYLIYYRTPMHVKVSKPEVFDDAIAAVNQYLTTKKVVVVADPERGVIRTQDTMSPQNLANLARDATADSVLLVSVDRPVASWIKLTIGAYDLSGNKLWEESASYGGGMNGKSAIDTTMQKLEPKPDAHLAKPGLPVKG